MQSQYYLLSRKEDVSGVSGTGIVAEAIEFSSGKVVVSWLVAPFSLSLHDSLEAAKQVHGHNGATEFLQSALINKGVDVEE